MLVQYQPQEILEEINTVVPQRGISGIYRIWNIKNNKSYIGRSWCLKSRLRSHIFLLHNGKHHNHLLQRSWNHYGSSAFSFQILDQHPPYPCPWKSEKVLERQWIEYYQSYIFNYGYNYLFQGKRVC